MTLTQRIALNKKRMQDKADSKARVTWMDKAYNSKRFNTSKVLLPKHTQ